MGPLERRYAARTAVVWEALRARLEEAGTTGQQIVDIGGGTGGFAVRLAELGHRVTLVDPSPDALAAAARRADERGVADLVTGVQGDLSEVTGLPEADLVLCHEVLGIVEDPVTALRTIGGLLRPGGTLSLLVGQRHAAVLARAMAGHFGQARELLQAPAVPAEDRRAGREGIRFTVEELTGLLDETGFAVEAVHAVRVFADLVPASLLDLEPGSVQSLLELERAVAQRPEYLTLAGQLHLLATH